MTTETKKLHEERAKLVTQMQEIKKQATEAGAWSADQEKKFDELDAAAEKLYKEAQRIEKLHALTSEEKEDILKSAKEEGKSSDQKKDENKKYLKAWCEYMLKGISSMSADSREVLIRAGQNVGTTTEGGFLVPEGFSFEYDKALLAYGGVLGNVRSISTTAGNDIPWPNTDDTANKSVILTEAGAVAASKDLVFGSTTLKAWMYSTDWIKVSLQLMQDSGIPIEQLVAEMLAERDARGLNYDFTLGNGTTAPQGVVTASTSGKTTASETAITANEIMALEHSVDPLYRVGGAFMMHDSILLEVKKLTFSTSDNRPLWDPGIVALGTPQTLLGYKIITNQDMASTLAADNKVMLFGNFQKYIHRKVLGQTILRANELFAGNLQVGFTGISRHDGRKITKSTVYPWKHLTMVNT